MTYVKTQVRMISVRIAPIIPPSSIATAAQIYAHRRDAEDGDAADDRAEDLGNDVDDEFLRAHSAFCKAGDGNRGIDVAAGYLTDRVGHRHDDQSEGKRRRNQFTACKSRYAACEKHEDECTNEFGKRFLEETFHIDSPFVNRIIHYPVSRLIDPIEFLRFIYLIELSSCEIIS